LAPGDAAPREACWGEKRRQEKKDRIHRIYRIGRIG
jgi:hypothetical protein